jgi:hypothetical protein
MKKTRTCKICKSIKPLTRDYFNTERYLENGNVTFRKACSDCEKANTKVLTKLKIDNPLPDNHQCPICLKKEKEINHARPWCCDHDHDTLQFRGWLCQRCNQSLGTVETAARSILYLTDAALRNSSTTT